MGMVLCDEPLGAVPIDLSYFESPIENDATSPVIGHTSQLAAAENLQVKCAQDRFAHSGSSAISMASCSCRPSQHVSNIHS